MSEPSRGSLFGVALVEQAWEKVAKQWEDAAAPMAKRELVDALRGHAGAASLRVSAEAFRNLATVTERQVRDAIADARLSDQARAKVLGTLGLAQLADRARIEAEEAAWGVMATGGLAPPDKQRAARTAREAATAWTTLLRELVKALVRDPDARADIVMAARKAARKEMHSG